MIFKCRNYQYETCGFCVDICNLLRLVNLYTYVIYIGIFGCLQLYLDGILIQM